MVASESDSYNSFDEFNAQVVVSDEYASDLYRYDLPVRVDEQCNTIIHTYGEFIVKTLPYDECLTETLYSDNSYHRQSKPGGTHQTSAVLMPQTSTTAGGAMPFASKARKRKD